MCEQNCDTKVCRMTIINGLNDYYTTLKSQYTGGGVGSNNKKETIKKKAAETTGKV